MLGSTSMSDLSSARELKDSWVSQKKKTRKTPEKIKKP